VGELSARWEALEKLGFTHVVVFAEEHRYGAGSAAKSAAAALRRLRGIWQSRSAEEDSDESRLDPAVQAYCEQKFTTIFEGKDAALYALPKETPRSSGK
jgi:hypothetical protein